MGIDRHVHNDFLDDRRPNSVEKFVLTAEVVVDLRLVRFRAARDAVDTRAGDAELAELAAGSFDQALPGCFGVTCRHQSILTN